MTTTPWKPSSYLGIPEKIKTKYLTGYRGRFCSKSQLSKKLAEGWEVVSITAEDKKFLNPPTLIDGKPLTSEVHVRELILVRMPEELAKGRDKYFAEVTDGGLDSSVQRYKDGTQMGNHPACATGKIEVIHGNK